MTGKEMDRVVDRDLEQLQSMCDLVEQSRGDQTNTMDDKDFDTKMIHHYNHIKFALEDAMQSMVDHASHTKGDIIFSCDHIADIMFVFGRLEYGPKFGLRHFFHTVKRYGLTYSDIILKMALPNLETFVKDVWLLSTLE